MYLIHNGTPSPDPDGTDPIIMRRRALIASALGLPAAFLPTWAASAATTPDRDHTLERGSFHDAYTNALHELDSLGARYVTQSGALDRHTIMDSGLWLYAQTATLANKAEPKDVRATRRLAAEAAMFTAGCFLDFGNERAASDLYSKAHLLCGDRDQDLRAFIAAQANWLPMYSGRWHSVLRRSEVVISQAEEHGGFGLLMGWVHKGHALAVLGDKEGACEALSRAQANIDRVPGARAPHSALRYSATKVWFSSSTAYAEMGYAERHSDAQHRAADDPTLGWIDANLMRLGQCQLDPDPEHAALRIRLQVLGLPRDSFNYCVRSAALRINGQLKARQITGPARRAGEEVRALDSYLSTVKVA